VDSLKFVAGGRGKVTLNGPKGIAIVGDTPWVADIDAVRGFDRKTGAAVASISVSGSGSRWADSSLDTIEQGKVTRLAGGLPGPADIGLDRAGGRVAVPLLTENRMELFELGTTAQ